MLNAPRGLRHHRGCKEGGRANRPPDRRRPFARGGRAYDGTDGQLHGQGQAPDRPRVEERRGRLGLRRPPQDDGLARPVQSKQDPPGTIEGQDRAGADSGRGAAAEMALGVHRPGGEPRPIVRKSAGGRPALHPPSIPADGPAEPPGVRLRHRDVPGDRGIGEGVGRTSFADPGCPPTDPLPRWLPRSPGG